MTSAHEILTHAAELSHEGQPYALATVVSVRRPASTRRGDRALVTADGTLTGWVGGACSQPIVVREALRALADGEPRLVRIGPPEAGAETADEPAAADDVVLATTTCASEGTVEVLIEPHLPTPLVAVVGDAPAAHVLVRLAHEVGWRVATDVRPDADAIVVATMGQADEQEISAALATSAGYVALVASARRAAAVRDALRARGIDEHVLARVRSPAGLDLGPSSQPEIAVAILAELVAWRHLRSGPLAHAGAVASSEALDPVCGMTVNVAAATASAVHEGVTYHFCSPDCRQRFEDDPARYVDRVKA